QQDEGTERRRFMNPHLFKTQRQASNFGLALKWHAFGLVLAIVFGAIRIASAQVPHAPDGMPARLEQIAARASGINIAAAQPSAPKPTQAPQAKAAAKPGGILRIGGERDVGDLDPHTTRIGWDINIMQNVYSGLVRAGNDILPQPDLATRWEFK